MRKGHITGVKREKVSPKIVEEIKSGIRGTFV